MAFSLNFFIRCWPRVCLLITIAVHFFIIEVEGRPLVKLRFDGSDQKQKNSASVKSKSKANNKELLGGSLGGQVGELSSELDTETDSILKDSNDQLKAMKKNIEKKGTKPVIDLDSQQISLDKQKTLLDYTQPHSKREMKKKEKLKVKLDQKQKDLDLLKELNATNGLTEYLIGSDVKVPDRPTNNQPNEDIDTLPVLEILDTKKGDKLIKGLRTGKAVKLTKDKKVVTQSDQDFSTLSSQDIDSHRVVSNLKDVDSVEVVDDGGEVRSGLLRKKKKKNRKGEKRPKISKKGKNNNKVLADSELAERDEDSLKAKEVEMNQEFE